MVSSGSLLGEPLIPDLIDELGGRVAGDDLCDGTRDEGAGCGGRRSLGGAGPEGVARNGGVIAALGATIRAPVTVPAGAQFAGALGAALLAAARSNERR